MAGLESIEGLESIQSLRCHIQLFQRPDNLHFQSQSLQTILKCVKVQSSRIYSDQKKHPLDKKHDAKCFTHTQLKPSLTICSTRLYALCVLTCTDMPKTKLP